MNKHWRRITSYYSPRKQSLNRLLKNLKIWQIQCQKGGYSIASLF